MGGGNNMKRPKSIFSGNYVSKEAGQSLEKLVMLVMVVGLHQLSFQLGVAYYSHRKCSNWAERHFYVASL